MMVSFLGDQRYLDPWMNDDFHCDFYIELMLKYIYITTALHHDCGKEAVGRCTRSIAPRGMVSSRGMIQVL